MITIEYIDQSECVGTIAPIDPVTGEGMDFTVVWQDNEYKYSIWIGISMIVPEGEGHCNEGEKDYPKGWHHDGYETMVDALAFIIDEYKA